MTISKKPIGETRDGRPVEEYTLSSASGITARVMTYGALLTSLTAADRDGKVDEITLGFDDLEGYLGEHPYFGATVGRYGNRIARGQFQIGGETYHLATNDGAHHLHGGIKAFDTGLASAAARETCSSISRNGGASPMMLVSSGAVAAIWLF